MQSGQLPVVRSLKRGAHCPSQTSTAEPRLPRDYSERILHLRPYLRAIIDPLVFPHTDAKLYCRGSVQLSAVSREVRTVFPYVDRRTSSASRLLRAESGASTLSSLCIRLYLFDRPRSVFVELNMQDIPHSGAVPVHKGFFRTVAVSVFPMT